MKPLFAVVDLGTNSFHLMIMQQNGDQIEVVDRYYEQVQMGYGIDDSGRLDEVTKKRVLNALEEIRSVMDRYELAGGRALGTMVFRSLNEPLFMEEAESLLGLQIELISGQEEAELVYRGVTFGEQLSTFENEVIFDIGGGSSELILGERGVIRAAISLDLGCVNMGRRFFKSGDFSEAQWSEARSYLSALLSDSPLTHFKLSVAQSESLCGPPKLFGTSGTIHLLHSLTRLERRRRGEEEEQLLTYRSLKLLEQALIEYGVGERVIEAYAPDLELDERALSIIGGGLLLLLHYMETLEIGALKTTHFSLREGVFLQLQEGH